MNKDEAKEIYSKIGSIHCPALKDKINFTAEGFHHLRYSSKSERNKKAQEMKFNFIKQAARTLEVATTVQEYRRALMPIGKPDASGLRPTKTVEWFGFLAITSFSKGVRILIIVRRIGGPGNGRLHFWSVIPKWTLTNNARIIGSKMIIDN